MAFGGWAHRPGASPFVRVERVSERCYLVVEDDRFNEHPFLYIVLGTSRTVLIDTGVGTLGSGSYAAWLHSWLRATLGEEEAARPLFVVNSHCHFDHVGGNAGFAASAEAIAASSLDRDFTGALLDPRRDASLARLVGCSELEAYTVTRWLADGERIALDDARADADALIALHAPGHTPDSLALWLAPERILFMGDTLYPHAEVILSNADSDLEAYATSLDKLAAFVRSQCAGDCAAVRLACAHVTHDLRFGALDEMRELVREVREGTEVPRLRRSPMSGGQSIVCYERGDLSLRVRAGDPALGRKLQHVPVRSTS
jgi:glyoxylase-like metal-dependent hydrolase (beta-lactamase superfamily II)